MKRLVPAFALIALFIPAAIAHAAPVATVAPEAASGSVKISRACHHYRWSSQRRCTSAKTLRFVARPPLFYPHRYFGGTPHYAQRFYWKPDDYYYYGWPYWRYRSYVSPWR